MVHTFTAIYLLTSSPGERYNLASLYPKPVQGLSRPDRLATVAGYFREMRLASVEAPLTPIDQSFIWSMQHPRFSSTHYPVP